MRYVDKVASRLGAGSVMNDEEFYQMMDEEGINVYRCPVCGRIHLEVEKNKFESYVREELR
jgi:uncharacterized OB-fold protein